MKVYVVTCEPYHENSSIEGVYSSLELAKNSMRRVSWSEIGPYVTNDTAVVAEASKGDDVYLIHEIEVDK